MENDIALAATGVVLARIGLSLVFGYAIYRVLRYAPHPVRERARPGSDATRHGRYARERYGVTRLDR